jgi:hypothetical protein
MSSVMKVSRRAFLAVAGASAAGALVLGVRVGEGAARGHAAASPSFSPNMWLSISTTGETNIWVAKAEMGQGVYTLRGFPRHRRKLERHDIV